MDTMKELEKLMEENKDVLIRLKRGKENKEHIHCPVNGWDCPYYKENGICGMYPDADPLLECDDFGYFWMDDDSMDYICYEDHTEKEKIK